jgi:soluble lytic murein transglycosylase-like protein
MPYLVSIGGADQQLADGRNIRHDQPVAQPGAAPPMPKLSPFLCVLGMLGMFAGSARADIYQYTDAQGTIHFTNTRPSNGQGRVYLRGEGRHTFNGTAVPPSDHDLGRFTRYDEYIRQAAALYQIPEQLVRAVIKVESDYDPRAVSTSGACGLMQLMPSTAEILQVHDIHDPRENIFGGTRFLRILANSFNGDLELTVAGYNAGEDAVVKAGGIPQIAETRDYVVKVTRFYRRYRTIADTMEASVGSD